MGTVDEGFTITHLISTHDRGLLLKRKPPNQGFVLDKLTSSLRKVYDPHHDLIKRYGISVS